MIKIIHGEALTVMRTMRDASIDLVLCDLPYGITQNKWDVPISFVPMWHELHRVAKQNAAIILMAAQPFASLLVCSNLKNFRYDIIWKKNKPTGFLNAKKQPLRIHEHFLIFYRKPPIFNPQKTNGHEPGHQATQSSHSSNYGTQVVQSYGGNTDRYPTSVLPIPIINNDDPEKVHPTQKPVELMRWMIESYSVPGAIVLDFAAGSGTTGVAAAAVNRHAILIEQNLKYVELIKRRCAQVELRT